MFYYAVYVYWIFATLFDFWLYSSLLCSRILTFGYCFVRFDFFSEFRCRSPVLRHSRASVGCCCKVRLSRPQNTTCQQMTANALLMLRRLRIRYKYSNEIRKTGSECEGNQITFRKTFQLQEDNCKLQFQSNVMRFLSIEKLSWFFPLWIQRQQLLFVKRKLK